MSDPVAEQLEILLMGGGFNYYRVENQLRADDLLIRQRAANCFGQVAARLEQLIQQFQSTCIPAATREQPYPSAELMGRLNALRSMKQRVMGQASFIHGLPAPAQDKIWRRLRDEETLLRSLLQSDVDMLQLANDVEKQVQSLTCDTWKSANAGDAITAALDRWDAAIRVRQELLQVQVNPHRS